MEQNRKAIYADDLLVAIRDDLSINSKAFAAMVRHINAAPAAELKPVIEMPTITDATKTALASIGASAHGEAVNDGG